MLFYDLTSYNCICSINPHKGGPWWYSNFFGREGAFTIHLVYSIKNLCLTFVKIYGTFISKVIYHYWTIVLDQIGLNLPWWIWRTLSRQVSRRSLLCAILAKFLRFPVDFYRVYHMSKMSNVTVVVSKKFTYHIHQLQ